MYSSTYVSSTELGFDRSQPKLRKREDGSRYYVPPESLEAYKPYLDPQGAIIGYGTGIYVLQDRGYMPDLDFANKIGAAWHEKMMNA